MIQNPDDLPLHELLGAEAECEAIEATKLVLLSSRAKTFKALWREAPKAR